MSTNIFESIAKAIEVFGAQSEVALLAVRDSENHEKQLGSFLSRASQ